MRNRNGATHSRQGTHNNRNSDYPPPPPEAYPPHLNGYNGPQPSHHTSHKSRHEQSHHAHGRAHSASAHAPAHHQNHPNGYAHAQPPVPSHYADASSKRLTKPTGTSSLLDVVANRAGPSNNGDYPPQGGNFDDDDYELMVSDRHRQTRPRKEVNPSRSAPSGAPGSENGNAGGEGIDGDDTKYCYCHRVSFGEMIGCDDENCSFQWVRFPAFMLCDPCLWILLSST